MGQLLGHGTKSWLDKTLFEYVQVLKDFKGQGLKDLVRYFQIPGLPKLIIFETVEFSGPYS